MSEKNNDREGAAEFHRASPTTSLLQTRVRALLSPYLPPPVVQAINRVDPQLEPYIGPEASVTIIMSLLVSWVVLLLIRSLTRRLTQSGSAIAKNDKIKSPLLQQEASDKFDATVLLVGPPDAGKTRLFYQLLRARDSSSNSHSNGFQQDMATLTSLRPTVGIAAAERVRYIDWPGIMSVTVDSNGRGSEESSLSSVWNSAPRIVLVIDSTQSSMGPAADVLYNLLMTFYKARHSLSSNNSKASLSRQPEPRIFIACHKQDIAKAKNPKRIKLQLRTELERLLQVNKAAAGSSSSMDEAVGAKEAVLWWPAGEPLELDQLDFCTLFFGASSCAKNISEDLLKFCATGELPSKDT